MSYVEDCRIIKHEKISPEYYLCRLNAPRISREAKPGSFIHVRVNGNDRLLLRRPFSLLEAGKGNVSFVYKVVGAGTSELARKKSGQALNVAGPLGHAYDVHKETRRVVLAAGGYGVSPTYFLARMMKEEKFNGEITSILGARTKSLLMYDNEFKKLGVKTHVTTDDGSAGRKGIVTDVLKGILEGVKENKVQVFACGPYAMLKAVAMTCGKFFVRCQVSMEQQLGCGIGACLGCVIKTTRGHERVCTEGPVFNAEDVIWE